VVCSPIPLEGVGPATMGRLSAPPPLVAKLSPAIAQAPANERERSRFRDNTQHWRAWYKTKRWAALRWHILVESRFTCRMCGRMQGDASNLTCDHIRPHRGDPTLFWDESNLQTLCSDPCHIKHKQAQEQAAWTI
jgi:5-methylcytosine-specific restriction protein A